MRVLMLLLATLLVGCPDKNPQPSPEPTPEGPVLELPWGTLPSLAGSLGSEAAQACQTAADCAVTCFVDASCCGQLCQCSNVFARSFAEQLELQRKASCDRVQCPVAMCMPPREEIVADCVENRCVRIVKPFPIPPGAILAPAPPPTRPHRH